MIDPRALVNSTRPWRRHKNTQYYVHVLERFWPAGRSSFVDVDYECHRSRAAAQLVAGGHCVFACVRTSSVIQLHHIRAVSVDVLPDSITWHHRTPVSAGPLYSRPRISRDVAAENCRLTCLHGDSVTNIWDKRQQDALLTADTDRIKAV